MAIADDDYTYTARDTSKGYAWLQIRTSLLDDPKYMQLPDQAKAVYFEVYLLAGRSDAGGLILAGDDPANVTEIAWILRRNDDDTRKALDQLQRAGLVDLTDDQVTVCRFASEQGPRMADKRQEWAKRQAKRRAIARGQEWHDPDDQTNSGAKSDADQDQNSESESEKNQKSDQEKNQNPESEQDNTKTYIKSVTDTSQKSHKRVTRDSVENGLNYEKDVQVYGNEILAIWNRLHGKTFKPGQKFWETILFWKDQDLPMQYARQALIQTQSTAETPMYVRDLAVQLRDNGPQVQAEKRQNGFRQFYLDQKNANGDTDTDGDE